MPQIDIPYAADKWQREDREGWASEGCIICSRKVDTSKPHAVVHLCAGGVKLDSRPYTCTGEDAGQCLYFYPIGPECKRKVPPEYVH